MASNLTESKAETSESSYPVSFEYGLFSSNKYLAKEREKKKEASDLSQKNHHISGT